MRSLLSLHQFPTAGGRLFGRYAAAHSRGTRGRGEPEKALDQVEPLLKIPSTFRPAG